MLEDFEVHGRLALIPLGILLGTAPIANRLDVGSPWIGINNVSNVALTILIVIMFRARGGARVNAVTAVFTVLMVFVWAQPGDGS